MNKQLHEKSSLEKAVADRIQKRNELNSVLVAGIDELSSTFLRKAKVLNARVAMFENQLKDIKDRLLEEKDNNEESAEIRIIYEDQQKLLEMDIESVKLKINENTQKLQYCNDLAQQALALSTAIEYQLNSFYNPGTGKRGIDKNKITHINWFSEKILENEQDVNEIIKGINNTIQMLQKLIPNSKMAQQIERIKIIKIAEEDLNYVNSVQQILSESVFGKAFDRIINVIIEERFPGQKSDVKKYRFGLYAQLRFCLLYFGLPQKKDQILLIDEGQDLAVNEYDLLWKCNGEDIIFNVFGDINQLIKMGRGIQDWNELDHIFPIDFFQINENYRNTNEITEYCNHEFNFDAIPIGLSGNPVLSLAKVKMLEILRNWKIKNLRIAIIINDQDYAEIVESLTASSIPFKIGEIQKGYITVIEVEKTKGLEFDVVFAVPEYMSKNEKYIAFTRALSELFVIK